MNVTHFDLYFHVPCPRGFTSNNLKAFKNSFNVRISNYSHANIEVLVQKVSGGDYVVITKQVFGVVREIHL